MYAIGALDQTIDQIKSHFNATAEKLQAYSGKSLNISTNYIQFDSYWDYYYETNRVNSAANTESALISRLFGKKHLSNRVSLKKMLNVTAGKPTELIGNGFGLVGGGSVLKKPDAFSGVNPAWRETYVMEYCAHGWANNASFATVAAAHHDITYVKGIALAEFALDTGSYMSEGDWQDPNYPQKLLRRCTSTA